jgi:hypothetical protein
MVMAPPLNGIPSHGLEAISSMSSPAVQCTQLAPGGPLEQHAAPGIDESFDEQPDAMETAGDAIEDAEDDEHNKQQYHGPHDSIATKDAIDVDVDAGEEELTATSTVSLSPPH